MAGLKYLIFHKYRKAAFWVAVLFVFFLFHCFLLCLPCEITRLAQR